MDGAYETLGGRSTATYHDYLEPVDQYYETVSGVTSRSRDSQYEQITPHGTGNVFRAPSSRNYTRLNGLTTAPPFYSALDRRSRAPPYEQGLRNINRVFVRLIILFISIQPYCHCFYDILVASLLYIR